MVGFKLEHCLAQLACEPGSLHTLIEPTYSDHHTPPCLYPYELTMQWLQAGGVCQFWAIGLFMFSSVAYYLYYKT